jgi:hypothetical protein
LGQQHRFDSDDFYELTLNMADLTAAWTDKSKTVNLERLHVVLDLYNGVLKSDGRIETLLAFVVDAFDLDPDDFRALARALMLRAEQQSKSVDAAHVDAAGSAAPATFLDRLTALADNYKVWIETDPSNDTLEAARADIRKARDALSDLLHIQTPREQAEQQAKRVAYEAERKAEEAERAADRAKYEAEVAARQKEWAEQEEKHDALKDRFRHFPLADLKQFYKLPDKDEDYYELKNKEGLAALLGEPVDDDIDDAVIGLLDEPIQASREAEEQRKREDHYKAEVKSPAKVKAKSRKEAERDAYKEAKDDDPDLRRDDWEWEEADQHQWETDFAEMWLRNYGMEFPNSQYA